MIDDIEIGDGNTIAEECEMAIVDNMGCTMIHIYGYTLARFPNILEKTIEALAYKDLRFVLANGEYRYIGESSIRTELQIDVSDDETGTDNLVKCPENLDLYEIGRRNFKVKGITLNTDIAFHKVNANVEIEIIDYITDAGEELGLSDEDNFKYERVITVWFIIK